jgi:hypothetical protein
MEPNGSLPYSQENSLGSQLRGMYLIIRMGFLKQASNILLNKE